MFPFPGSQDKGKGDGNNVGIASFYRPGLNQTCLYRQKRQTAYKDKLVLQTFLICFYFQELIQLLEVPMQVLQKPPNLKRQMMPKKKMKYKFLFKTIDLSLF
jgi:hypothetical protein